MTGNLDFGNFHWKAVIFSRSLLYILPSTTKLSKLHISLQVPLYKIIQKNPSQDLDLGFEEQ